jgi:alkanesulfonate monooxygenase SsuD/methylene tetrahydromethanopterin reductase-like flavin-dependent oxidoreductase (luciferase family)
MTWLGGCTTVRSDTKIYIPNGPWLTFQASRRSPWACGCRMDCSAGRRACASSRTGWLALWVSPARYADATGLIGKYADEAGRVVAEWQHGMHVWCGLGASPSAARDRLAAAMEGFYRVPFGKFERYCPSGTPEQIAAGLRPYVEAGCRSFNLIPVADNEQAAIEAVDAVRGLLREEHR